MKIQQSTKRKLKVILGGLSFAMLVFLTAYVIFLQTKINNIQNIVKQVQVSSATQPVKTKKHRAARRKSNSTTPSSTTTQ